jgi:hypothetical protein
MDLLRPPWALARVTEETANHLRRALADTRVASVYDPYLEATT